MRRCKCGSKGPFSSHPTTADRLHPWCKKCEAARHRAYGKTPKGKAARAWSSLRQRSQNATGRTPTYENVEVRMTRSEFMSWAVPAFEQWFAKHPDKVPSVDRKNNDGHYELGNIRLLEKVKNQLRSARYKNVNNCPPGKAWCSGCTDYHPKTVFGKCSRTPNGLQSMCRKAHKEYMRKYRGG